MSEKSQAGRVVLVGVWNGQVFFAPPNAKAWFMSASEQDTVNLDDFLFDQPEPPDEPFIISGD